MTPFVHAAVSSPLQSAGKLIRAATARAAARTRRAARIGPVHLARFGCAALTLAGCAAGTATPRTPDVRSAEDTPPQFVTEDGVAPRQECRSPLLDPRDQTRLRLVRSVPIGTSYRGDYEVPLGRYGVGEGELLRIECETGQAIGIVRN